MRFEVVMFGEKVVATKFTRMARDTANARPAFNRVATYLMDITGKQFSSQGRRGGGRWRPLTEEWLRRKIAKGGDPRILHFRGALRNSVTVPKARGQVLKIGPTSLEFGSKLPYAAVQQFGGGKSNLPARPFLRTTASDRAHMRDVIRDHLMQQWSKRGGTRGR